MLMISQAGIPCNWANDGQRFLLDHFDTIKKSPSYIYCSALPFCPSSSWLSNCYSAEFLQEVKVVQGVLAGWGKCSRTVSFDELIGCLSCWNNTTAVGFYDSNIIILDTITGSQTATFSGHKDVVNCLVFSSDGKSLVSGSNDKTVKLWDMQTGGVVKTFSGHTSYVQSVSISADFATIASGTFDQSICLWSIHTEKCYCVIKQESAVWHVRFSPTDPQHLLSVCDKKVWRWNTNGDQAGPTYDGSDIAFSPDGTQFVVCNKESVMVQNSSSGVTVTKLHMANGVNPWNCCFSPDGKLIAVSDRDLSYVWDITGSDPHLIETFHEHVGVIFNCAFSSPSSLISATHRLVRFWQIGSSSKDLAGTDPRSTSLTSVDGKVITLQAKDGITITSEQEVLKVWDTTTSLCKASFQIPPTKYYVEHAQLVNGKLIFAWSQGNVLGARDQSINLWDVEEGKLLWAVDGHGYLHDIKISQNGARVFCLFEDSLQALSAETGKVMGQVKVKAGDKSLTVEGSWAWVHYTNSEHQGWNFGNSDAPPVQLLGVFPYQCPLNSTL
jgi:WD40 repeat protein